MDLDPYVEALRADLVSAAAAGTEATRDTAQLLAGALDSSLRLCLVDALSTMAAEVTALSDSQSVEIRMHGREPQVVVLPLDLASATGDGPPADVPPSVDGEDDGATARITLRLPEPLKAQAEQRAGADGLSVNAWLVRAVGQALHGAPRTTGSPGAAPGRDAQALGARGRRISGFARS